MHTGSVAAGRTSSALLPSLRKSQCALTHASLCSDILECRPREGPSNSLAPRVVQVCLPLCGGNEDRQYIPCRPRNPEG